MHVWFQHSNVVAGGNYEANPWADMLPQGFGMYLQDLGLLAMIVVAAAFMLTAVSLSVFGLMFFGWVPAILLSESLDIAQSLPHASPYVHPMMACPLAVGSIMYMLIGTICCNRIVSLLPQLNAWMQHLRCTGMHAEHA